MRSFLSRILCVLVGACLLAVPALAQQTYQRVVPFSTTNRPLWSGDQTGSYAFTAGWDRSANVSDSINTYVLGSYGGGIKASSDGSMRLEFIGKVRDARVNVSYPITVTLTYPNNGVLYPGDTFTISTAYTPSTAARIEVGGLDASLAVNTRLSAGLSLRAWLELASVDVFDGSIVSTNLNTGTVNLFDSDWRDSWYRNLDNFLIVTVQKPEITASGSLDGTKLVASGRSPFATMVGNITNIACKLAGVPTPNKEGSKDIGVTLSYDTKLASLEAQTGLDLGQNFTFTPTPMVELLLSTGQVVQVPLGQTVTLTMPSVPAGTPRNDIQFIPECTLPNTLYNRTRLILGNGFYFNPFKIQANMRVPEVGGVNMNFDPFGRYRLASVDTPVTLHEGTTSVGGFGSATLAPFVLEGYVYPTPVISAITPIMVRQGSGAAVLTVTGEDFVDVHGINPSTKVLWNGAERVTQFVSATEVHGHLTAADNNTEGLHAISVLNPPPGGGPSVATRPYIVDGTAPVTTNTRTGPEGRRGWFVGDVRVDLTATDNLAGVARTTYAVDGGAPVTQTFALPTTPPPYTAPQATDSFIVTGDLIHTVTYASVDHVGNPETTQTQIIKLDTTVPELTGDLSPRELWPVNKKMVAIEVWGTMTDNLSGIDRDSAYFFVVDEYGQVEPGGPVPVREDGTYRFTTALQAHRLGTDRDGRTYTLHVGVFDMAGWHTAIPLVVTVPHDQRKVEVRK